MFRSLFSRFVLTTKTTETRSQVFSVNGSITYNQAALLTSFWRHRFNMTKLLPNLVNSSWLWWIMRVSQQICISYWNHKICRKATAIRLFSIFYNLKLKGIQVPSEFFWRSKFFPTSWTAVFSQVWRRSIFKFCVYKLAEAVRYLKFKWEFVIIGRGCLVLLKFKSSLCWRMLCFKAL